VKLHGDGAAISKLNVDSEGGVRGEPLWLQARSHFQLGLRGTRQQKRARQERRAQNTGQQQDAQAHDKCDVSADEKLPG
jgi:hypothetical protein